MTPAARRIPRHARWPFAGAAIGVIGLLLGAAALRSAQAGDVPESPRGVADRPAAQPPHAAVPAANEPLCGELRKIDGLTVLRLWGTARQRGFAHGYLLAAEIRQLLIDYLDEKRISGGPETYLKISLPAAQTMLAVRPLYERELRGIAEGVVARLGPAGATIPALQRPVEYADLLALNAASDWLQPLCSSFAVWGPLTADGSTLTGRNLDWHRVRGMVGSQIVIAQLPAAKPRRAGWVGVGWPGFIGCLTGMSDQGVTVAIHDVPRQRPKQPFGLTPRGLALREVIETVAGESTIADAAALLRQRRAALGTNVLISRPAEPGSTAPVAAVLEYDGLTDRESGVTVRLPQSFLAADARPADSNRAAAAEGDAIANGDAHAGGDAAASPACAVACTNHYRARRDAPACDRYADMAKALSDLERRHARLNLSAAWAMLAEVAEPRPEAGESLLTYHSVVFEPNARRMQVALTHDNQPAARGPHTRLALSELLVAPRSAARTSAAPSGTTR
ncbi:MAG: C45 family peptidase [Phycisphaerae bacterium]